MTSPWWSRLKDYSHQPLLEEYSNILTVSWFTAAVRMNTAVGTTLTCDDSWQLMTVLTVSVEVINYGNTKRQVSPRGILWTYCTEHCLCGMSCVSMRRLSNYQHHIHNEKKRTIYKREKCNFYLVRWKTRRWSFYAISHLLKTYRGWTRRCASRYALLLRK